MNNESAGSYDQQYFKIKLMDHFDYWYVGKDFRKKETETEKC